MMIDSLARNQNWAKVAPWAGIFFTVLLFANFSVYDPHFWGLINIPLYLFHQTEEHYVPGGFKDFMNRTVMALPQGQEKLTDIKNLLDKYPYGMASICCLWCLELY